MIRFFELLLTHGARAISTLVVSLIAPLLITYTIPYYWMNVMGIFVCSTVLQWLIIDPSIWVYKKIKTARAQA